MSNKYSEEIKEKWVMFFLSKYDHCRPARLTKDKINNSIAKFWDNDSFWDAFLESFDLLKLEPGSKIPKNINEAVVVFWSIIKDGLNYKEKQAKAKLKEEAKLEANKEETKNIKLNLKIKDDIDIAMHYYYDDYVDAGNGW